MSKSKSSSASTQITKAYQRLIEFELISIFLVSLIVSVIRLDQPLVKVLSEYPGFPKVLILPIAWYFFLHQTHAWDRSILLNSNDYYSRVLKASSFSLVAFSAFCYLAKYPISRLWVFWNILAISLTILLIRYIIRKVYFRNLKDYSNLRYIYLGKESSLKGAVEEFTAINGFTPMITRLSPPGDSDQDDWLMHYEELIRSSKSYGVIIGVGEIQDAGLLRKIADTRRSEVIDLTLETKIGAIAPRFERVESANLVRIRETPISVGGSIIKRLFDIAFSVVALTLLSPVMLITALLVRVSSPGPILYKDRRVGRNGTIFTMPKFRSMYVGSDKLRQEVLGRPDSDMYERYKKDPRITPVGRFIRRWSLDELPQFWSVLVGKMSVVGPRPVLEEELSQITSSYQIRFLAKPGLTGLWQVTGRKEVPWKERMIRDVSYIDDWSFSYDLILIAKTILVILKGNGAH